MKRVDFTKHNGQKILVLDFSNLLPDDLKAVVVEAEELIHSQPPKSLLTITRVNGAHFDTGTVNTLKNFAKGNDPYVRKAAIVGLQGLQKLVLNAVSKFSNRNFVVCHDMDEAQEWLTA